MTESMLGAIVVDGSPRGYRRDPALQATFEAAAARLRAEDAYPSVAQPGQDRQLVADLALEGGGVKGIGLVGAVLVLDEAGYVFRGIAGTSAGAIAAGLIAGLSVTHREMTDLLRYMRDLSFPQFMPKRRLHRLLARLGRIGEAAADAAILLRGPGIYPGTYLQEWLGAILHDDLGIRTFADLRLTKEADPGLSLPPERCYRLVVHTSDITRGELVRLPWDYDFYGHVADGEDPVQAVRASMSIPFFFRPVPFATEEGAHVELPTTGGGTTTVTYAPGSGTLVDGGMLRNFPITAFDRIDGAPPRWPTIGIKLSRLQTQFPPTAQSTSSFGVGLRCLQTLLNEWDSYAVDEATAARTIFVDTDGISATDFALTAEQQNTLFLNGVRAATQFVIDMAAEGGVPRTSDDARQRLARRRDGAGGNGPAVPGSPA